MENLVGKRFGRLTVVGRAPKPPTQAYYAIRWDVLCDCGEQRSVFGNSLRTGNTKSCGCLRDEQARVNMLAAVGKGTGNTRHGLSRTPEWNVWYDMRKRCTRWKHPHFAYYGGRGIIVCERWQIFENFLADLGPKPGPKHTLDRINNEGNYEPGNVRWATRKEQARNRRTSRLLTAYGKTQTLAAWAEDLGMKPGRIRMRIDAFGWSVERALSK